VVSGALPMQILVSVVGIAAMTGLAYYRSWSKRVEKAKPAPAGASKPAPDLGLEHDPEMCAAVFRKDHAQSKT